MDIPCRKICAFNLVNAPSIPYLLLLFLFFTFSLGVFLLAPRYVFAECYVTVNPDQLAAGACGPIQSSGPCAGQYQCTGNTQPDGNGSTCQACVAPPPDTPQTCSTADVCPGDQWTRASCPRRCTGQTDPSNPCKYCVNPVCPAGACDDGVDPNTVSCVPCSNITCSVYEATPTGPTTADAKSKVTSGQPFGYDGVNWYLNGSQVGTTAMNADGTASNSFTNLVAGTSYTLTSQYFDNEGGRPAVSCSGYTFQFNPPSTQMTCSLSVSPQTIEQGGSAKWSITNNPAGATATWGGTNPDGSNVSGPVQGYSNTTSWTSPAWIYNTSGSYTRYAQIKDSGGTLKCTTDTVSLFVNPQSCSSNPISVSPSSFSLSVGGSGQGVSASGTKGTVSWSSGNTSVATISPSFGTSTTVSPGTTTGTTSVTAADARSGGVTCRASTSVSVSSSTVPGCPGGINACGDSAYGGLTPSATSPNGCDGAGGTWSYPGNTTWNSWCSQQKGVTSGYYCYQCNPGTGGSSPSPTPGPISAGFTTGSIVVKGPLLLGRILQDINASFSIDSPDKLIEKLTSIVSGKVLTTLGLLDITGRMQNVLAHGAAVYHMWTNECFFGCSADQSAVQQEIVTATGAGAGGSSNFIKISNSAVCTSSSGTGNNCTYRGGSPGSYTRTTTYAQNPQQGFSARLVQSASFTQGYRNQTNSVYTDILSYIPTNVESNSCATGCTVQSKIELDYSTRQNNRVVSSLLNPDGTCFLKEEVCPPDSCANTFFSFDPVNQTYILTRETYYQGQSITYSSNYYTNCTRYDIGRNERITPWSLSFTSPVVVSSGSLAINDWRNLFSISDPESCSYDASRQPQVNPASARQYCTCQLSDWCDGGGCTTSATFDCNFPLKSGLSFGDAPAGDYIFEVTASTGNPIGYRITAGGVIANGSQSPSGGKLSVKFNVPDSAIGQRINVVLNQAGRDFEEVTFGAPALYPIGWYEASINFGRTATTGLSQARVIDPPEDYPYTIGMIPPAGNYCSKTSSLEQCYLSLSAAPLNSSNINQVDFLLGNIKSGGWFQVKDADLHATGSLISRIPSSCKTPKCTPSFDLSGPGGFPGVPAYTGTSSFGSGTVSDKGWLAKSGYSGKRYDYAYFRSLANSSGRAIDLRARFADRIGADGILTLEKNDISSIAGSDEANFAVFDGRIVVSGSEGAVNLEGKKLVLLAGGDVLIQSRINLRAGEGFFGLFSGGSIVVDPAVKSENPNQYGLEGVFLADGAVHTGTKNPIPNSGEADNQIYIRGMLAGWQGVILERDLDPLRQTGANNDKPAEFIEYAPDLVLNFPKELLRQGSVWREVAP